MKFSAPAKENHWALWNWWINNPNLAKCDWPGFDTMRRLNIARPPSSCFACSLYSYDCDKCPIEKGCKGYILTFETSKELKIKIRDMWK